MRIRNEYLLSADRFKKPEVLHDKDAIAMLLMRIILMDPGTNPLHPDMGIGIRQWRYGMGTLEELQKRAQSQIDTYIPEISSAVVSLVENPNHTIDIEIAVGDMVYIYDSATAPVPITLSDIISED